MGISLGHVIILSLFLLAIAIAFGIVIFWKVGRAAVRKFFSKS